MVSRLCGVQFLSLMGVPALFCRSYFSGSRWRGGSIGACRRRVRRFFVVGCWAEIHELPRDKHSSMVAIFGISLFLHRSLDLNQLIGSIALIDWNWVSSYRHDPSYLMCLRGCGLSLVPLLHQCGEMHVQGVVAGGHLAENCPQLLVLFLHACHLRLHGCQLSQANSELLVMDD